MEKERNNKDLIEKNKPKTASDMRKSEDVDDLIFEEEGYKCSEK